MNPAASSPVPDRPLAGRTIALTRAPARAGALGTALREAGATVLTVPVVDFAWPADLGPLDAALTGLRDRLHSWLAVTSATTVTALTRRAAAIGTGFPELLTAGAVRVAAVGAGTAAALERAGVTVDLVPAAGSGADALLAAWPELPREETLRSVLLPHSDLAAGTLAAGLTDRGWAVRTVTAYRTVDHPAAPEDALDQAHESEDALTVAVAQDRRPDAVVVTSPSTLRRWLAVGDPCPIVAIGPTTAGAADDAGHPAVATADTADAFAVLDAVARVVREITGTSSARSDPATTPRTTTERRWES